MSRPLALIVVLLFPALVAADDKDWTGKTVKLKFDNLKMGTKFRGGLVRDGAALDKSKTYAVKSDDGSYLELVGQTGFIFKSEAEMVAAAPSAKGNEKNLWSVDTKVLPKKRPGEIRFGDRDRTGTPVYFEMSGIMPMLVRKDLGDGWVRIHDGHREGWVRKDDLITREDAPSYWDGAVKANPKDTWALYMRGNGWWQKGDLDTAIADFNECIRLDPADSGAYNSRGNAWRDKKEYDKAIADFTAAIRLEPTFSLAYHNRGNAQRNKKEHDKAIADYTQAIRFDPQYAPAYINRGFSWADKKEYDKAIADFTAAIRLDPKDASTYSHRGDAWLARKEYDKAIADYTETIRFDPNHIRARIARGWARHCQKKYEQAIADYDGALELDPKSATAIADKALTLAKLKKYEEAVKGFETALKLDPMDWVHRDYAHFLAACPDAKYRDGKKAVELAKKAIEKAGKDASWEYFAALAAASAEAGDFELATAEQRKVIEDKSLDKDDRKKMEARLDLYRAKKPYRDN